MDHSDQYRVIVSCKELRKLYAQGNYNILKYMACVAPMNSETQGLSVFYKEGPQIRDIIHYNSNDPASVNPVTGKRDMREIPDWAHVCIDAQCVKGQIGDLLVTYVDGPPPSRLQRLHSMLHIQER